MKTVLFLLLSTSTAYAQTEPPDLVKSEYSCQVKDYPGVVSEFYVQSSGTNKAIKDKYLTGKNYASRDTSLFVSENERLAKRCNDQIAMSKSHYICVGTNENNIAVDWTQERVAIVDITNPYLFIFEATFEYYNECYESLQAMQNDLVCVANFSFADRKFTVKDLKKHSGFPPYTQFATFEECIRSITK